MKKFNAGFFGYLTSMLVRPTPKQEETSFHKIVRKELLKTKMSEIIIWENDDGSFIYAKGKKVEIFRAKEWTAAEHSFLSEDFVGVEIDGLAFIRATYYGYIINFEFASKFEALMGLVSVSIRDKKDEEFVVSRISANSGGEVHFTITGRKIYADIEEKIKDIEKVLEEVKIWEDALVGEERNGFVLVKFSLESHGDKQVFAFYFVSKIEFAKFMEFLKSK